MLLENGPYSQDTRVPAEATALVSAGYTVSVICPRGTQKGWRDMLDGVRVYRYPAPPDGDGLLGYLWEYGYSMVAMLLLSLVVAFSEGFDVIHAHCPPDTSVLIAALYKPFGKSFVYDHHDLAPEMYYARFRDGGNRWVYRALVLLEKLSCRLASRVIATNESYKAVEMERGRVPAERIYVVRNGPNLERLQPAEPAPALQQRASTILGYVGHMGPQDGVDYLLRALHHLVYDLDRRDVFCVVVGKGDMLSELKALAEELETERYVWFTGWIPDEDLLRYLSTADICLDPDPSNPFTDRSTMVKMMEYMALGKPIVAFDLPEHRVTAQDAAVYARPNDELDFARQIAALMDDPERRRAMGAKGRKRIEEELAWPHQIGFLLEAYESLFEERDGGQR
jgi:glycosyltransferase involved in cell wall biosynthesis